MAGLRNGDKNELQQGRWEPAAPSLSSPHSTFMVPERPGYTSAEVACTQAAGSAAAPGGALLNFARMGFLGMLENNAESSMFEILSQPLDVGVQQSRHNKQHGGEPERRHINSATPPPQPPARRANQPTYGCTPAGRQLSRSVPSSPTFVTNRLHMSTAIRGGGDMSGASTPPAGRAGNGLPVLSTSLSAHVNSSQQASSTSASVLTTSPDLASCTSNLVPPSPGSVRSAGFGCDHAAAATASSFCNDHAAKSASISTDPSASTPRTASSIINNEHAARSGAYSSDQVRPANFSSDQASRSANFSDLAAAASLFLPSCFPSTPASSTSSQNPATAAPDDQRGDHQVLQGAAGSCTVNNVQGVAKKRRLQVAGGEGCSKAASGGDEADYGGCPDIFASLLPLSSTAAEGDTNADIVPIGSEMSNNSANIEGEESTMKCNNSITSTSKCMKTQVCEGPPPPKQDYIHVRARRGQATDSHSLAERVRREKISERMRFLQDLVPGCNKITGKAVMLDEIINYVQSLQRQVEFLSMKLSAVSPQSNRFETNHFVKQVDPKSMQMGTTLQFNQTEHHHHQHDLQLSMPLLLDAKQQQAGPQLQLQLPSTMGAPQAWEDELQSLVQMGFPSLP